MEKTIAAISTANGIGGLGVIRISGENAIETAEKIFVSVSGKKLSELKGYTAAYGKIYDGDELIDEAVVLVFRAPHSYTGEDVAEIFLEVLQGIHLRKERQGVGFFRRGKEIHRRSD